MGQGSSTAKTVTDKITSDISKTTGGKPVVPAPTPSLTGMERQTVYQNLPNVVNLKDPNFSNTWLGTYKVRPTLPDNNSVVPDAFLPTNQRYGINKHWNEAEVAPGTSLYDRMIGSPTAFAKSTLNPNPMKNPLLNPNPLKNSITNPNPINNILTNPLKIFGF